MSIAPRLTRSDQQAGTRARLLECAHDVFVRSGFHAATLEAIALQAGVTKGAVYSNFAGKAELFLAVNAARMEERVRRYRQAHADGTRLDAFVRSYMRIVLHDDPDGRWASVVAEACAAAAGDAEFREALIGQVGRANAVIGDAIADLADRTGVEFRLPRAQMIKVGGALMRGLLLQRLLDPQNMSKAFIEDVYVAFMQAMVRPTSGAARSTGGAPEGRTSHEQRRAASRSRKRPAARRGA
jgi:AcrR family transcriptional regulator